MYHLEKTALASFEGSADLIFLGGGLRRWHLELQGGAPCHVELPMSLFATNLAKMGITIFIINLRGFVLSPNRGWNVLPRAIKLIPFLPPHHELGEVQDDAHVGMQSSWDPSQMSCIAFQDQRQAKKCYTCALQHP